MERAWEREDRDSARHHHRVKRNPGRARHTEVRDRARLRSVAESRIMGLQAAMVVAMVAASCDGVAMANAEARRLASSDVTQAILPPESRACRAVPRGAALVVAQPVSGWLRETWAHEDTARGSDFLSDTPLRAGPPGSALSQHEELFSCVPAWPSVVDGWMATTEPPKIEARRKVPRGAASATAPPAASWWRETCTRDFTACGKGGCRVVRGVALRLPLMTSPCTPYASRRRR